MLFKSTSTAASVPSGKPAALSILSLDLQVTGDIVAMGELHITGSVKGDITAKRVTIGEGGSVTGVVEAAFVHVAGALTGRIAATVVVLAAGSRVVADITHVALRIEEGAAFQGHSTRVNSIDKAKTGPLLALPASQPAVSTPPYGHKNGSAAPADDRVRGPAAAS